MPGLGHHAGQCRVDVCLAQRSQRCGRTGTKGAYRGAGVGQVEGAAAQCPGVCSFDQRHIDEVVAAEVALKTHLVAHLAAPLVGTGVGTTVDIVVARASADRLTAAAAHINVVAITQVNINAGGGERSLKLARQADQLGHVNRIIVGRAGDVHPVQFAVFIPVVGVGADINLQRAVCKPQGLNIKDKISTLAAQVR